MSKTVFPQDTVGEFFNANFINLKVQMDQTDHDAPETKSWYKEAQRFAADYQVVAYPTFLIFDPQGELVHRIVGGGEAGDFIARAKQGLDPKTQYVTLVNKYRQNPDDAILSKQMLNAALGAYDRPLAQEAASRYIELLGEEAMLTPDNIDILLRGAKSSDSPAFTMIKNNKDKVDELLMDANHTANDILASVLVAELVAPRIRNKEEHIDFVALKNKIEKEYPYVDMTSTIARAKTKYYFSQDNWPAFKDAVQEYIETSDHDISPLELNSYAWSVFENCDDLACLQAALAWSKTSISETEVPNFVDTYANLLYKSGDTENAIRWQKKAVENTTGHDKETFTATLQKMQNGEPTW